MNKDHVKAWGISDEERRFWREDRNRNAYLCEAPLPSKAEQDQAKGRDNASI